MRLRGWRQAAGTGRPGLRASVLVCLPGAHAGVSLLLLVVMLVCHSSGIDAYVLDGKRGEDTTDTHSGSVAGGRGPPRGRSKRSLDVHIPAGPLFHGLEPHPNRQPFDTGLVMKPVPVVYFTRKLEEAKSYHDVLRIFYGDKVSDVALDNMLENSASQSVLSESESDDEDEDFPEEPDDHINPFEINPSVFVDGNASPINDNCETCDTNMVRSKRKDALRHTGGGAIGRSEQNIHHRNKKNRNLHKRKGKRRKGKKKKGNREEPLSQLALDKAFANLQEVNEKSCRHPEPELIRIRDVSDSPHTYAPECTVIHRCKATSGCCDAAFTCAPKTTQKIKRYFYVVQSDGGTLMVESFVFTNHTECECKPVKQIQKCLECPFPFFLRRQGTECSCDCFDGDKNCMKIKRGRKPVTQKEISCIEDGKCHKPNCPHGRFNMRTGYCPKKGKHRRRNNKNDDKETVDDTQTLTLGQGRPLQADLSDSSDHKLGVT